MKQININLYRFSELSEAAKEKAIGKHYDILTYWNWWEYIYEDAKRIGLSIDGFDLYPRIINIKFEDDPEVVANNILKEWGGMTKMAELANNYLANAAKCEVIETDDELIDSDELMELNEDFLNDLGKYFLNFLETDYEWRSSDSAIGEELEEQEFYFLEDGSRFYNI